MTQSETGRLEQERPKNGQSENERSEYERPELVNGWKSASTEIKRKTEFERKTEIERKTEFERNTEIERKTEFDRKTEFERKIELEHGIRAWNFYMDSQYEIWLRKWNVELRYGNGTRNLDRCGKRDLDSKMIFVKI